MKWYSFRDMHSGGTQKSKHDMYLIEAESELSAVTVFRNETGRDPNHVTCGCCGEDYSIIEWDSKEQLMESMAYERDMKIIPTSHKENSMSYELQYFIDGAWQEQQGKWCRIADAMFDANFNTGKARVIEHNNGKQRVVMTRENNFAWERV